MNSLDSPLVRHLLNPFFDKHTFSRTQTRIGGTQKIVSLTRDRTVTSDLDINRVCYMRLVYHLISRPISFLKFQPTLSPVSIRDYNKLLSSRRQIRLILTQASLLRQQCIIMHLHGEGDTRRGLIQNRGGRQSQREDDNLL